MYTCRGNRENSTVHLSGANSSRSGGVLFPGVKELSSNRREARKWGEKTPPLVSGENGRHVGVKKVLFPESGPKRGSQKSKRPCGGIQNTVELKIKKDAKEVRPRRQSRGGEATI